MKRRYSILKTRTIVLTCFSIALMIISGLPMDFFSYSASARRPNPPQVNDLVHRWDFNIKNGGNGRWKYTAETDDYNVSFARTSSSKVSQIQTKSSGYEFVLQVGNLSCVNFASNQGNNTNGTHLIYHNRNAVRPVVNGTYLTYPNIYPNIDLQYQVCFGEVKECFVVKSVGKNRGDLMFYTGVRFDTGNVSAYNNGRLVNSTINTTGDIEFRDGNGRLVYRIPSPIIFDTPEKIYDHCRRKWVNDIDSIDYLQCKYRLNRTEWGIGIEYRLPFSYISKDSIRFPIYVDPSINPSTITETITYESWFNNTIKRTDSSGVTYLEGLEIVQESDVTVNNGGSLTLNNITLKMDSLSTIKLEVNDGGCLNIVNNSLITWGNNNNYYGLNYGYGSTGVIDKSTIERISGNDLGVNLHSDITVMNTTISHCEKNGIYVYDSSPLIYNNVFYNNSQAGMLVGYGGAPKVYKNNFTENLNGILWEGNYWDDDFDDSSRIDDECNVVRSNGKIRPYGGNSVKWTFDYSTEGFEKMNDQSYSDVYWDNSNNNVFFKTDRADPEGTHERLEKTMPYPITSEKDWHVNITFSLTHRSAAGGEKVFALYLNNEEDTKAIYVDCYGGDAVTNNYKDTIYLRTKNGPTITWYDTQRSGSGSYNDKYFVDFYYNTSTNRIYGKICDGNNHSNVYSSGNQVYDDFSMEDIAVGSADGDAYGTPLYYEGNVDEVSCYFGNISNIVDWSFDDSSEGFVKKDDQEYSDVYWDDGNDYVFFKTDRRDPVGTNERLGRDLPYPVTNHYDWRVNISFALTYRYNPVWGCQVAYPLYISNKENTESIFVFCYGGNVDLNDKKDIIYIKTNNATIATKNTTRGGHGVPYNDKYFVDIYYNATFNRVYGKICDGNDPSIILASGDIYYDDFIMEDIDVGRAQGDGLEDPIYYEGYVDQVFCNFGNVTLDSYIVSERMELNRHNLFDHIEIVKEEANDCTFLVDVLDGDTWEVIPGLDRITGTGIDISCINPVEYDSIRLRGKFYGNRNNTTMIDGWAVYFRPVSRYDESANYLRNPEMENVYQISDSIILNGTGLLNGYTMFDDFMGNSLDPRWAESCYGTEGGTDIDVDGNSLLVPLNYGNGNSWHGPTVTTNLSEASGSFVFEAKYQEDNSGGGQMGEMVIEILDGLGNLIYKCIWSDAWAGDYSSYIVFSDDHQALYNSGKGTTYNDFNGKMKIERIENRDLNFYIDNGAGYEKITLSHRSSTSSLAGVAEKLRISVGEYDIFDSLTENKLDWVNFTRPNLGYTIKDDFDGETLHARWEELYCGDAYDSEVGVDGVSNIFPINYGNGQGWYGPRSLVDLTDTEDSFVVEAKFDQENDGLSMGEAKIEILDENGNRLYLFLWFDAWSSSQSWADKTQIIFYDHGGELYNSGAGTTYNDFDGMVKIERIENSDIELYIDNGEGYEEMTLSDTKSAFSLDGNASKMQMNHTKYTTYPELPKNKQDWISFRGDYNITGSMTTDLIYPGSHCLWDTIAISKYEPDMNHHITITLLDGSSGNLIEGYTELRGSMIDIGTLKVSEFPSVRIKFNFYGNGSTTPELYGWRVHSTPVIYDNVFYNNTDSGIFCNHSSPTIAYNEIKYNSIGIQYYQSPMNALISEEAEATYETYYIDHFLSHGRLSDWSDVTILNDKAELENGKNSGYVISENISLEESWRWHGLKLEKDIPDNCYLNVSVLDPDTETPITGYGNLIGSNISLVNIEPEIYPKIKLKADLVGNGSAYPSIREWRVVTRMIDAFNDTLDDVGNLSGGQNVVLDTGYLRLDNRTWWNNDYKYRRNISLSEELGINRTDEYHDFHVNFSTWSHKPNCSDEIRVVYSNGVEADREITNFVWNQSVDFTFLIENITLNEDSHFFMYYGCDSPTTPNSVDYAQTTVILDENDAISDIGGGWGPSNVGDTSVSMIHYSEGGAVAPQGDYMAKIHGNDTSAVSDSAWYAEFSDASKTIPAGQFLGYYIYWVNTTSASALSGGLDGNYSGGGSLGEGNPVANDQNNLGFCPDVDISAYANNTWYYRYTDDVGGKTIEHWFIAYNDTANSEEGLFTFYFDYVFFGPNRGPLFVSMSEEETRYYQNGYAISMPVSTLPYNSEWGTLRVNTTIDENQSIYFSIMDAGDDSIIPGYSYLTGNNISLIGIDTIEYPSIQLVANFMTNGSGTPKLYQWDIDWAHIYLNGMAVGNLIRYNDIGILSDHSYPSILDNTIIKNSESGIKVNSSRSQPMTYTKAIDGIFDSNLFYSAGDVEDILRLRSRSTLINVSFEIDGSRYIPWADVDCGYKYTGVARAVENELALNGSISVDRPDPWKNIDVVLFYYNLTDSETPVNATDINLNAWHNYTNISFTDSSSLIIESDTIVDNEDPVVINITSDAGNAKLNISAEVSVSNYTSNSWNRNDQGYDTTIVLYHPNSNVYEPGLVVYPPQYGFARIECTVVETSQSLGDNFTITDGGLVLPLSDVDGIGDIWNGSDSDYTLDIHLIYYLDSPGLDIGADGILDWEWDGELNETVTVYPNSIFDEVSDGVDIPLMYPVDLPFTLRAESAGYLNITCIQLTTLYMPDVYGNVIEDSVAGIEISNTSELRVGYNEIYGNGVGINFLSTVSPVYRYNHLGDGQEIIDISLAGEGDGSNSIILPPNAIVTDLDLTITGDRYVPESEWETGYQTQGKVIYSNLSEINSTLNFHPPVGWNNSKLTIYANNLTRENGDNVVFWGNDTGVVSSAYLNATLWRWCNNVERPNISFVESVNIPDSTMAFIAMSNDNNELFLYKWEDNRIVNEYNKVTTALRTSPRKNFDLCMVGESPVVFWANDSGQLVATTLENGELSNKSVDIDEICQVNVGYVPWDDGVLGIVVNESGYIYSTFFDGDDFSTPELLTTLYDGPNNISYSLVMDTDNEETVLAWQCSNGTMVISKYTSGAGWSNESYLEYAESIAIKSVFNSSSNDILIIYVNKSNELRALQWNGSDIEQVFTLGSNVDNPDEKVFDVIYNTEGNMLLVAWYDNHIIHLKEFNGSQWNWFDNRTAYDLQSLNMSTHPLNTNFSLTYRDINNTINCFMGDNISIDVSAALLGANVTCFIAVFEHPLVPPIPSILNLSATTNNFTKSFIDCQNCSMFWSGEIPHTIEFNVSLNKTLYEYCTGLFNSNLEVYNETGDDWTRTHTGYFMNVSLFSPSMNLSEPELKLFVPNSYVTSVEVWVNESDPTGYKIDTSFIDTSGKSDGYIVIHLINVTEIGRYWTPDDSPVILTIYINYTPEEFYLDVGSNDIYEFEEDGVFNYSIILNSNRNITAREANLNLIHTTSSLNEIPFYVNSETAVNVSVSDIIVEYVLGPICLHNDIHDNELGIAVHSSPAIIESNDIVDSTNDTVLLDGGEHVVNLNTISGGGYGINVTESSARLFENSIDKAAIGINASGEVVEIYGNTIDNNTIGIDVQLSQLLRIENNIIEDNIDGIVCNKNMTSEIRDNTIRENEEHGIFCDNGTNVAILENTLDDTNVGIYMLYCNATIETNTLSNNEIGLYSNNFFYFDFNKETDTSNYDGWVNTTVAEYSEVRGFGYLDNLSTHGINGSEGNPLQRDCHYSSLNRTFKVDVPNGEYDITVFFGIGNITIPGEPIQPTETNQSVYLDDVLFFEDVVTTQNEFISRIDNWTVINGTIRFEFKRSTEEQYWFIDGISVVPKNTTNKSHFGGNILESNYIGAYQNGSSYLRITNSTFTNNEYGVLLANDSIGQIEACNYAFNTYGVYTNSSYLDIFDSEIYGSSENDFTMTENSSVVSTSTFSFNQTIDEGCKWKDVFTHWVGDKPVDVRIGDINDDGYNDIVTSNEGDGKVTILYWDNVTKYWDNVEYIHTRAGPGGASPVAVEIGNVRGNAPNEIVTVDADHDIASVIWWDAGDSPPSWSVTEINPGVNSAPVSVDIAEVNGTSDGEEIVIACRDTAKVQIYGKWDDQSQSHPNLDSIDIKSDDEPPINLKPTDVVCKDVDADSDVEIVVGAKFEQIGFPNKYYIIVYEYINGEWIHAHNTPVELQKHISSIDVGDVISDCNNYHEILVSHDSTDNVTVLEFDGNDWGFASIDGFLVGDEPTDVHHCVNSYGDSLIMTVDHGDDQITIKNPYRPNDVQTLSVGSGSKSIFTGDVDGDGDTDIVVTNEDDDNVEIIEWSGGSFHHKITLSIFTVQWDEDNKRENDVPISGTNVTVYDPNDNILEKGTTDEDGFVAIVVLQDFMTSSTFFHYGNYTIRSAHDDYANRSDYAIDVMERTEYYSALYSEDDDDDGISDADEVMIWGTDKNDFDTDDDGLGDGTEVGKDAFTTEWLNDSGFNNFDTDPLSRTNPTKADTDGDGLTDWEEDENRNGAVDSCEPNPTDSDTDDDGLMDGDEDVNANGAVDQDETDPLLWDTDGGGIADGMEVEMDMDPLDNSDDYLLLQERRESSSYESGGQGFGGEINDSDGDGLSNEWENDTTNLSCELADSDSDGINDAEEDFDVDNLCNLYEFWAATNPWVNDTNSDGISDYDEDYDNDGLSNGIEQNLGTWPGNWDSDNDSLSDGEEDYDKDGIVKIFGERYIETDPLNSDTDADNLSDGYEIPLDANRNKLAFFIDEYRYPDQFDYSYFDGEMDLSQVSGNMAPGIYQIWVFARPFLNTQTYTHTIDFEIIHKPSGSNICEDSVTLVEQYCYSTRTSRMGAYYYRWYRTHNCIMVNPNNYMIRTNVDGVGIQKLMLLRIDYNSRQIIKIDTDGDQQVDNIYLAFSDPLTRDSDGDTVNDGIEVQTDYTNPWDYSSNNLDSDGDGLSNSAELQGWDVYIWQEETGTYNQNGLYKKHRYSNPFSVDSDNDGLSDFEEYTLASDASYEDTDIDHIPDSLDNSICGKENLRPSFRWKTWGTHWETVSALLHMKLWDVNDLAGIQEIYIKIQSSTGNSEEWSLSWNPYTKDSVEMEKTWTVYCTNSYDITFRVIDSNNYVTTKTKHISSAFECTYDLLQEGLEWAEEKWERCKEWAKDQLQNVVKESVEFTMKYVVDPLLVLVSTSMELISTYIDGAIEFGPEDGASVRSVIEFIKSYIPFIPSLGSIFRTIGALGSLCDLVGLANWFKEHYYHLFFSPFVRCQGLTNLCWAYSCLMIAHYHSELGENINDIREHDSDKSNQGADYDDAKDYLDSIGHFESSSASILWSKILEELGDEHDPVYCSSDNLLYIYDGHAVVIVGYIDTFFSKFLLICDPFLDFIIYPYPIRLSQIRTSNSAYELKQVLYTK